MLPILEFACKGGFSQVDLASQAKIFILEESKPSKSACSYASACGAKKIG
jgi:hypothetical protein